MEKVPIEIFVDQQLQKLRYQTIITQLGVETALVKLALVTYLRSQGVFMVTPALGAELSDRIAEELEQKRGVATNLNNLIVTRKHG